MTANYHTRSESTRRMGKKGDDIMIRKLITTLALTGLALTATACNTVKGVGKDIQSVGEAGDKAINH